MDIVTKDDENGTDAAQPGVGRPAGRASSSAVRWIEAQSEWLEPDHPLAVGLVLIAEAMDAETHVPASLATAFRLTMGDLVKLQPVDEDANDDPDDLFSY